MTTANSKKITKRYMYFCTDCNHLTFQAQRCEACGSQQMVETPKRYGLTNLACISMSVMDFEAMKQEFIQERACKIG